MVRQLHQIVNESLDDPPDLYPHSVPSFALNPLHEKELSGFGDAAFDPGTRVALLACEEVSLMRKLLVVALAAVCVLGVASLSLAAQKAAPKNASHRMLGEVVSVDPAGHTFTIKETVKGGEAKEVMFTFDEKGKVMVAGKPGRLEDLKAGDSVTVRYTEKDGNKVAQDLHVAKPAAAKAASK